MSAILSQILGVLVCVCILRLLERAQPAASSANVPAPTPAPTPAPEAAPRASAKTPRKTAPAPRSADGTRLCTECGQPAKKGGRPLCRECFVKVTANKAAKAVSQAAAAADEAGVYFDRPRSGHKAKRSSKPRSEGVAPAPTANLRPGAIPASLGAIKPAPIPAYEAPVPEAYNPGFGLTGQAPVAPVAHPEVKTAPKLCECGCGTALTGRQQRWASHACGVTYWKNTLRGEVETAQAEQFAKALGVSVDEVKALLRKGA